MASKTIGGIRADCIFRNVASLENSGQAIGIDGYCEEAVYLLWAYVLSDRHTFAGVFDVDGVLYRHVGNVFGR